MPIKVTTKCRICGNPDLKFILSLGHQPLSGVFPRPEAPDPNVSPLELIRCNKESKPDACGLDSFHPENSQGGDHRQILGCLHQFQTPFPLLGDRSSTENIFS